jgi:AAA+ superfamily predicted ATPase
MFLRFLRKGVFHAVSACLNWRHNLVCFDLDSEMYNTAAGYRRNFSSILRLSPCDKETLRFNILDEITEENVFQDVYMFADIFLAQADRKADLIAVDYAKDLLAGAILHCKCSDYRNKSMSGVLSFLYYADENNKNDKYNIIFNNMINSYHCSEEIHEIICNFAKRLRLLSCNMLENIFSLVLNSIKIFDYPLTRSFSDSSDFRINDFNVFDKPVSLFITVPPSDFNMVFPYISIIIRLIDRLCPENKANIKNPVMAIFDDCLKNGEYLKNNNNRGNMIYFSNNNPDKNLLLKILYNKKINLPAVKERDVFLLECSDSSKPDKDSKQWYDIPDEMYMRQEDLSFEPLFTSRIPGEDDFESEEYKHHFEKLSDGDKNIKSGKKVKDVEFIKHQKIPDMNLFFNEEVNEKLNVLEKSLQIDEFNKIKDRFSELGKKCGFICMLYGESGAGKTEAVLQLAKRTKRDLLKLDISIIRKTRVGRSEKAINRIFSKYRKIYEESKVVPVLFINEADGLFQTRTGDIGNSPNKTLALDFNTTQNLLLDKLECFEGIMIGTSNFIENMDKAFERRILYKIKFSKPDKETQKKIWKDKMKGLSDETVEKLVNKYNFTGGIIDNVVKKHDIEYILSEKKADFENLEKLCGMEYQEKEEKRIGFI